MFVKKCRQTKNDTLKSNNILFMIVGRYYCLILQYKLSFVSYQAMNCCCFKCIVCRISSTLNFTRNTEIAEGDIEHLKASQQKLLDARPEMRQLDKEIQNIHVILGEEDTADKDFVDADNISDKHPVLLRQIDKILRRDQQLQSSKSTLLAGSGASKQLKHSALKLPKMSLPVFDGDRKKWLSFWDVFKSEVHDVKDISNVTKFNFLKGQYVVRASESESGRYHGHRR